MPHKQVTPPTEPPHPGQPPSDAEFAEFARGAAQPRHSAELVWSTDPTGLWEEYLDAFPEAHRKYHDCRCCRKFVERYGSLVTINQHGDVQSVFWNDGGVDAVTYYGRVAAKMRRLIARKTPIRPFFDPGEGDRSGVHTWGVSYTAAGYNTGAHHHWYGVPHAAWRKTGQEDHAGAVEQGVKAVNTALRGTRDVVARAQELIRLGRVPRAEKISPVVDALAAIHAVPWQPLRETHRDNVIRYWLGRVPSLCHLRSSVAFTFIEDLNAEGADVAVAKLSAKVDGTVYMRPTEAPAAQTLERAEALFVEKGYDRSLARRWARVDEIPTIWSQPPTVAPAETSRVFQGVRPRDAGSVQADPPALSEMVKTWVVFERDILPHAVKIELHIPNNRLPVLYYTMPKDPEAPNILRDSVGLGMYGYKGGVVPSSANLVDGSTVVVSAIAPGRGDDVTRGRYALVPGTRDMLGGHTGLFPEALIPELHPYRSVVEAYNKANPLPKATDEDGTIAGVNIAHGARLRVTTATSVMDVRIDRFE